MTRAGEVTSAVLPSENIRAPTVSRNENGLTMRVIVAPQPSS